VAIGIADTVAAARNLDAGKIIKEKIAPLIKGGGGGQKNTCYRRRPGCRKSKRGD
jgi:alanyl-tRNA synthetase